MRNPLQDQLLKAGLVKKSKAAQIVREQTKQRHGKPVPATEAPKVDTRQLQAERAERDRALAAERNAQARANETRAQIRQIVETNKLQRDGEIAYAFNDDGKIKRLLVDEAQRTQLAKGSLVIVRHDQGHELVPRPAADKVYARDAAMVVLDNAHTDGTGGTDEDDEFYKKFEVPDDLIW
ncbi:MAG: DUF2058 domain-containing protein [Lysobacter sp.]